MIVGHQFRAETITVPNGSAAHPGMYPITMQCDWIYIYYVSRSTWISFDDGPPVPIWGEITFRVPCKKVTFLGLTGFTPQVAYIAGRGVPPKFPDAQNRVTEFVSTTDVSCGAGATTTIISTSSILTYPFVWISIPSTAVGGLKIGDSAVSSSKGLWLEPGVQPLRLRSLSGVYGYNPNGSAVAVTLVQEKVA